MEINNIIREEFHKILKEGYVMEHDNFKFTQVVENTSFYNYQNFSNDYDVNINESQIIVNWRIGFLLNDMGIEKFLIQADSVEGTYKVALHDKQTDEVSQEVDKNIAEIPWKFKINPTNIKTGEGLYIDSIEFDFETKISTVNFFDTNNQEL